MTSWTVSDELRTLATRLTRWRDLLAGWPRSEGGGILRENWGYAGSVDLASRLC
jgi:hypothetical protein